MQRTADSQTAVFEKSIDWGRTLPILAGGTLVAVGLAKRSTLGYVMAGIGGGVALSGYAARSLNLSNVTPNNWEWVKRAITIGGTPEDLYDFWSKTENLARIFPGVDSIEPQPNGHWLWRFSKAGHEMTFETENVTHEKPHAMHWKSGSSAPVDHHGKIEFRPGPADRGTEVELRLSWKLKDPASRILSTFGLMGKASGWYGSEALRRAKQLFETGELSTASIGAD